MGKFTCHCFSFCASYGTTSGERVDKPTFRPTLKNFEYEMQYHAHTPFRNFMLHKFQFEYKTEVSIRFLKTKKKRGSRFVFSFGEQIWPLFCIHYSKYLWCIKFPKQKWWRVSFKKI